MPPTTFLIKPASSHCNMRCKYCFYADVAENRSTPSLGMMSEQTLEVLVKKALEYADGFCTFAFQGGEPTLAGLPFYRRLIELQKKYNTKKVTISNAIQTNGYLIDEEWAEFLAQNKFLVGLSLDGPKDIHDKLRVDVSGEGTFDKILHATKLFDRFGVEYNILCVVGSLVARHGKQVYQFFKKNKFRYVQFIQCLDSFDGTKQPHSLTAERYGNFLNATFDLYYKDFMNGEYTSIRTFDNYVGMLLGRPPESCGMSGICSCYFVVEGDGSVYPCDFYVLDKYRLGDIQQDEIGQMLQSDSSKQFVEESKYIDEKCRSCKWLNLCRGGCRRCREPFVEGRPSLNQFCKSYQMFFEHSYDKLVQIASNLRNMRR